MPEGCRELDAESPPPPQFPSAVDRLRGRGFRDCRLPAVTAEGNKACCPGRKNSPAKTFLPQQRLSEQQGKAVRSHPQSCSSFLLTVDILHPSSTPQPVRSASTHLWFFFFPVNFSLLIRIATMSIFADGSYHKGARVSLGHVPRGQLQVHETRTLYGPLPFPE